MIGGVTSDMPDTSDTDTEQTDPAAPDNDEADTAQVTDSSEDAEEVAPAYATIEEFLAAVAAVGEVDTQEDLLAAIDNCLSIYDRLSPEDQAAQTEMYEYIVGYREEVAAGNPDAGIEELALTTGHSFQVKVAKVYLGESGNQETQYINVTCTYSSGHSSGNCKTQLKQFHPTKFGWSTNGWLGYRKDQYGTWSANSSYNGTFYTWQNNDIMLTCSSGGDRAWDTIYLVYSDPVPTKVTLTYNANGAWNSPPAAQTADRGTQITIKGKENMTREGYEFLGWSKDRNARTADWQSGNSFTLNEDTTLYAVWEKYNGKGIEIEKNRVSINGDPDKTTAQEGDIIQWEVRVTNNSNVTKNVTLTEKLEGAVFTESGKNILEITLAPGASETVTVSYKVKAEDAGTTVYNTVKASTGGEGDKENPEDTDGGTEIIGSTDPDTITVTWKDGYTDTPIKVETVDKNIEDEELKELYPDDPTREGYEFDGWGELETDEDGNITITATWKPLDPTDETTTLEVTKTADKKEVKAGDTIQYKIEVKNSGSVKAKDVKVTDKLDTGKLEFESWSLNGGEPKTTKPADDCYMIGDIEAGKTAVLVITARVKDSVSTGTKINNAATADYTNKPEDAPDPEDEVTVTVVSDYMPTTLEVKKEADKQKVAAGEEIEYTITVTNKGANEAKDVVVADKLPEELELVSARIGDEEAEKNDAGAYIIGSLPAGQKAELVITAKVKGEVAVGTVIKNVATAEYVNKPEDETDPKDEVTVEVVDKDEADRKITIWYVDEDGNVLKEQVITEDPKSGDSYKKDVDYDVTTRVENEFTDEEGNNYVKNGDPDVALTGTMRDKDILIKVPYALKDTEPENPTNPTNPIDPADPTDPTPTPPGGGGGGGNGGGSDPDPTPTPGPATPTPGPTPIIPGSVPTVGPTPVVPTVTPVAATPAAPTPTAALVSPTPEAVELADEAVPLAAEEDKQPELEAVDEEETPLAGGKGAAWALINFALMNLAIFESVMLLIGYFVKTKNDDEEEKRKLKKKGIFRIISLPVAIISLIAFILTEDITLPTAFVDKYTIVMLIIAIVQTVMVALSNKKYEDEQEV